MKLKKALLGTTALLGAGAALLVAQPAAALEVKVGGFSRFLAAFGDLKDESGNADSQSFYFRNDTEVHVTVSGKDDATGMEYGAKVEFEADTNANANTDETWIWVSGNWGELRFGDEDGAADNMKVGGFSVAAGTGGIDGAGEVASAPIFFDNSGDATKIRYDSPVIGGFQLGVSYTPDSGHGGAAANPSHNTPADRKHWIEGGLVYSGSFSGVDIKASGVLGFAEYEGNDNDFFGWGVGAQVGFMGFKVAGGFFDENDDLGGDRTIWNVGGGATLGPVDLSVTYARADLDATNTEPWNLVFSGTVGLFPGVSLQGDVSIFDRDAGGDDDGVTGVARLHISY